MQTQGRQVIYPDALVFQSGGATNVSVSDHITPPEITRRDGHSRLKNAKRDRNKRSHTCKLVTHFCSLRGKKQICFISSTVATGYIFFHLLRWSTHTAVNPYTLESRGSGIADVDPSRCAIHRLTATQWAEQMHTKHTWKKTE